MVKLNDVYQKIKHSWVSRAIADEVVIMPLCRSEEDMQYIYSISNETGSRIWQLLDGRHTAQDIQEAMKREYEGRGEVMEREVLKFIEGLLEVQLIKRTKLVHDVRTTDEERGTKEDGRGAAVKKKPYKSPEICKVKMQAEQAVLSCCTGVLDMKSQIITNICAESPGCVDQACNSIGPTGTGGSVSS